jgi:hypothetical protein
MKQISKIILRNLPVPQGRSTNPRLKTRRGDSGGVISEGAGKIKLCKVERCRVETKEGGAVPQSLREYLRCQERDN